MVSTPVTGAPTGSNSQITYQTDAEVPQIMYVTQSPSAISSACNYIIPITLTSTSTVFYVNVDRINYVFANGTGSNVYFNRSWAENVIFTVNETPAAIQVLIDAVVVSGGGGQVNQVAAHAGGGQTSATQLTYGYTEIITVTTALDSVKLPAGVIGAKITLLNKGANIANVFPATGGTINGGSANAAIPIAPGVTLGFTCIDGTDWETSAQVVALQDGTVGAPSLTFEDDADTGIYRIGANEIGIATNGAKVLDISTAGLGVTGTLSSGADTITSASANALAVGLTGATNPAFNVDASTASQVAGITVKGAVTGGTVAVSATDSGSNTSVTLDGKGTGTLGINTASTTAGLVILGNSTSLAGILSNGNITMNTAGGVVLGTAGSYNAVNLGTTPVGTVSIKEYTTGKDVVAVLTLNNFIVGALAGAGAALGLGNIFYATPAGQEVEIAYGADSLVFTAAGTAVTGVFGIGSVIASGAVSVLSGTATFQDRFTGTAATTGAGGGAAVSGLKTATAGALTGIALNVAGSVKNFFLNFAGTWNANNTGNLTCSGTIVVKYSIM